MKKRYIALLFIATFFVTFILTLFFAPSIAKSYVEAHSKELIGRKVAIESIGFNPFSFTINIKNLAVYEPDDTTRFLGFEHFRINPNPSNLIFKEINIEEIYMKGLFVNVEQNGSQFNFSDILEFFSNQDSSATNSTLATTKPKVEEMGVKDEKDVGKDSLSVNTQDIEKNIGFNIAVKNIKFENGNIIYQDKKVQSKFHLKDFSLNIPAVYFNDKNTDIGLNLTFADGGKLGVNVQMNMKSQNFGVQVDLEQFALACAKPYMNNFISYKDFRGLLNTHINVQGNIASPLNADISGTVAIDSIQLTENNDKTIGVKHVGVGIKNVNLEKNRFHVDSLIVDGAFAHLDLYKKGHTNIDVLLKAKEPQNDSTYTDTVSTPKAETPKEMDLVVSKLLVKNTSFTANDFTITKSFNYTVSGISVNGSNINFVSPFSVNVGATLPGGGDVSLKYRGSLKNMGTMDAYLSVKNVALKNFSNYSHHYTGYPISGGTLAFASENKMENFNIESKNTIDIYNINVDDKDPNVNPEFTVPMKVGLYILKDKDEKIQFDVPVKGNVKDPEFSYFKIIWKTVMNLMIKVALSPLKIVGNVAATGASAVGLDLGKNDEILIDPYTASFTSEQYAKATKMVEILAKDPKLTLTLTQMYSLKKSITEYKNQKLKTEFYKQANNKQSLNELDEKSILEISDKDSAFVAYTSENQGKIDTKALEMELKALADKRNAELLKVLEQQPGVTKKNLKIINSPRGTLNSYKGKAMYKVQIDVH